MQTKHKSKKKNDEISKQRIDTDYALKSKLINDFAEHLI